MVHRLEAGSTTLEDALALWERGEALAVPLPGLARRRARAPGRRPGPGRRARRAVGPERGGRARGRPRGRRRRPTRGGRVSQGHRPAEPDDAAPAPRAGNAPGGSAQDVPTRSSKAPAEHDPFRPVADPELTARAAGHLPRLPARGPRPARRARRRRRADRRGGAHRHRRAARRGAVGPPGRLAGERGRRPRPARPRRRAGQLVRRRRARQRPAVPPGAGERAALGGLGPGRPHLDRPRPAGRRRQRDLRVRPRVGPARPRAAASRR